MAALTAAQLIVELAKRMQEYAASTPTAAGTATSLIDTNLNKVYPVDVGGATRPLGIWVYGTATADAANVGTENRAVSWVASTSTLAFLANWATAPTMGLYEIHQRTSRTRKLEAINEAIGELNLTWYRSVAVLTSATVQNQWSYTLPASIPWTAINKIQVQINTAAGLAGYPYGGGELWDADIYPSVDASGTTTWTMQFGKLPPPGRLIRIFGQAGYADLVNDTDVLPLQADWQRMATAWIYQYAQYLLYSWEENSMPATQVERLRQKKMETLQIAKDYVMAHAPTHGSSRIITPGRGTGEWAGNSSSSDYIAAYKTLH